MPDRRLGRIWPLPCATLEHGSSPWSTLSHCHFGCRRFDSRLFCGRAAVAMSGGWAPRFILERPQSKTHNPTPVPMLTVATANRTLAARAKLFVRVVSSA